MFSLMKNKQNSSKASGRGSPVRYHKSALLTLTFLLAFSIGTAWSYDGFVSTQAYKVTPTVTYAKTSPPSAAADVCLSLLKTTTTQHTSPFSASVRNQRNAGVAALGIILGARFALEPQNRNMGAKSVHYKKQTHDNKDNSALAVVAYRDCQKKQALISVASLK